MKKLFYAFVLITILLQSCTYKKVKVSRTVSKTLNFTFNINQVGNFQASQLMAARDIIALFDAEKNSVVSSEIKNIDIKTVKIGATVGPANTAQQVELSGDILTGALLNKPTLFLNKTKTIEISNDIDIIGAVGNALGAKDENNLQNAVSLLNAAGADELRKAILENLQLVNQAGFSVRLNGTVPAGQRLVMKITLAIEASITFTRCEEVLIDMFYGPLVLGTPFADPTDECQ
jgi:hypothetical protein